MTVAVVTITHDRTAHLLRQREGLAGGPPDLHVVVGMGEEPDPAALPGLPPVVTMHVPVGGAGLPLAAARNAGAAAAGAAGADVLVFLDVDCIPAPALVHRYAAAARAVPGPALLCGPVAYLPPPGPAGYPRAGLDRLAGPHPARPAPPDGAVLRDDRFALFWSLSFAVTRASWELFGGFHEGYVGYGGEDTDFALTAQQAGAGLHWVGGATAYHQHHRPARETPSRAAEIVRNARLFRGRNGWWPMAEWLHAMHDRGWVVFDPDRDLLEIGRAGARTPTGRTA